MLKDERFNLNTLTIILSFVVLCASMTHPQTP
jgi:hypothetical protein